MRHIRRITAKIGAKVKFIKDRQILAILSGNPAGLTVDEIEKYRLVLLKDDQHFFPEYQAVSFYASTLPVQAKKILSKLTSLISEPSNSFVFNNSVISLPAY